MRIFLVLLLLMNSSNAHTQDQSAAPPKPCSAPEHRQFDFWVGKWRVQGPKGKLAGINEITSILGGCVIHENWSGAGGMRGQSFNSYDAERKVWHQTWVDNTGTVLLLDGTFADGRMVLSNERGAHRDRITWTPKGDGLVQVWDRSEDSGKTWTNLFTGTYVREQ